MSQSEIWINTVGDINSFIDTKNQSKFADKLHENFHAMICDAVAKDGGNAERAFYEKHIQPLVDKKLLDADSDYGAAISETQRAAFLTGFNIAVKMMG